MSIDGLRKQIDSILRELEQQQQSRATGESDQVFIMLPIKDGEPAEPRQQGHIAFYVPLSRLNEAL